MEQDEIHRLSVVKAILDDIQLVAIRNHPVYSSMVKIVSYRYYKDNKRRGGVRYQEDVRAMVTMTSSATEKVQDFIQEHGVEADNGLGALSRSASLPSRPESLRLG